MSANLQDFFQDLQWRGLIANAANLKNIYQLEQEEKVIYFGIDCTGETLHIGHLLSLIQTIRFAKEGFQILLVLGGATSKIGDPSDKNEERPLLSETDIENYQKKIKSQLERILIRPKKIEKLNFAPLELFFFDNQELLNQIHHILKIKNEASTEKWEEYLKYIWPLKKNNFTILNNNDWLSRVSFIDFANQVGRNISVNYLLAKETIKQRVSSKTGLSFLAFSYSLLQAYDFYYLYENYNCRGQLGGSDQWGNLTTGLELIRKHCSKKKAVSKAFAFNFPLLTDKEGKKFSKSENGGKTWRLNSEKEDLIDFFLNLSDEEIQIFIKQFTFLSEAQIKELKKIPAKWRVLQRIMVELMWFLNYGNLELFKNALETREEKVRSSRQKKSE